MPARKTSAKVVKSLNVTGMNGLKKKVSDVETFGDPGAWQCLGKAWSKKQGWMKSTKVMQLEPDGVLVQVSTQQQNPDGSYAVAEALTYVPCATLQNMGGDKIEIVTDPDEGDY